MTLHVPGVSDSEIEALCERYEGYLVEYSAEGEVILMPPTDSETGGENASIIADLKNWARSNPGGYAVDSATGFRFPGGSRYSPDAAWI